MDALLADSSRHTSRDARRLERLRKTVARRERSRAHLRKAHSAELATEPPNATSQLEAREALQRIEAKVTSTQWAVITALGQGYSFADIGLEQGISAGAARAQIFRLRQHLSELRPAA